MKVVSGRVVSKSAIVDDWDPDECSCAGKVPDDKRIDVQQRVFDEKHGRHRWKTFVRYHQNCPIHGCNHRSDECPEA